MNYRPHSITLKEENRENGKEGEGKRERKKGGREPEGTEGRPGKSARRREGRGQVGQGNGQG